MRSVIANRLADNGQLWTELFAYENSGTYNNQVRQSEKKKKAIQTLKLNAVSVDGDRYKAIYSRTTNSIWNSLDYRTNPWLHPKVPGPFVHLRPKFNSPYAALMSAQFLPQRDTGHLTTFLTLRKFITLVDIPMVLVREQPSISV